MTEGKKPQIFDGVLLCNYRASDWDLDEKLDPCLFGEEEFPT